MSVLKGEGSVLILFGSTSIAVGSRLHSGYLARPNLTGEWPTVVVVPTVWGLSSAIKALCRSLARHGLAVVALDHFEQRGPARSEGREAFVRATEALDPVRVRTALNDVVSFIRNPAGFWSSAEDGFGVLAVGAGIRFAADLAVEADPAALGLAYTLQNDALNERLSGYDGPILGLWGNADETADLDAARRLRETNPRTEIVIYGGVGHAFLDDGDDHYDAGAADDALERMVEFFSKHLPPPPPA